MNVYAIYDRKMREYGHQLVLERNDFVVQRGLADGIQQAGESLLAKHPGDHDLYQVGEFDVETGQLSPAVTPRLVCSIRELVPVTPSLLKEG